MQKIGFIVGLTSWPSDALGGQWAERRRTSRNHTTRLRGMPNYGDGSTTGNLQR